MTVIVQDNHLTAGAWAACDWARTTKIGYGVVTKRLASNAFLLPTSTTDLNYKNLRTTLELLKLPDEFFASKVI